jgi:hypothetical protein
LVKISTREGLVAVWKIGKFFKVLKDLWLYEIGKFFKVHQFLVPIYFLGKVESSTIWSMDQ